MFIYRLIYKSLQIYSQNLENVVKLCSDYKWVRGREVDYNNFREKVYYINLRDMIMYISITIGISTLLLIMALFNKKVALDLIELIGLIITMALLMFSTHLKCLINREIYSLFQIFLIISCIIYLVLLIPEGHFIYLKFLLNNIGCNKIYNIRYMNLVIMYYVTSKYRKQENVGKFICIEYIFLLVLSIIIEYAQNIYSWLPISAIYILIVLVFILLAYKHIHSFDFKVDKKVDLLKLNVFLALIIFFIKLIAELFNLYLMNYTAVIVIRIFCISTFIAIMGNIVKEGYNFIFKETIDTSNQLEFINREIIKNNNSLEETYNKLKDIQILYRSFLESLPNSIVIINNKFRISYCNSKFLNEIGKKSIREVINRRIDNYIDFDFNLSKKALDSYCEPQIKTIDFNNKKIEIRLFCINNKEKEFIMLFKDLTEEIKLSTIKEELEDIRVREEIKKNFLSNISHDIKIPINIIYSAIQLEKNLIYKNDIKKIKYYNEVSKENCFILTKLTNNLIDLSKIDSKNLETNLGLDNIVRFIEDYLVSLTPYINNNGINVVFDTDEEEIYIYFDEEMMKRIILNLISNSIKFTNYGGLISIKIKNLENHVIIEIKDNGIGMSKEFVDKVFNEYEMEEESRTNNQTGDRISLFVVYNLIKAQNGNIEINSEVGKGTTFIIYLNK